MELKHRRLLYISFILFFLIFTPILILNTTGYRYNFKKNRLEKTGILVLDSQPKGAKIFLNDKYVGQTPKRLTKILPDYYLVEIKKDNYHTWRQKLEVKSSLTTFEKNVVLFRQNLPIIKVDGQINIISTSPNKNGIIYSTVNNDLEELHFLNFKNDTDIIIDQFNLKTYNAIEFVDWSPNQKKALIKKTIGEFSQFIIADIETLKVKELFDITRLAFEQVKWDKKNDAFLYGLKGSVLYQINLAENITDAVISDHITDFAVYGKEIYYLTQVAGEFFLNQAIISGPTETLKSKIKLPAPSQFSLKDSPGKNLVIIDRMNKDLFIIDPAVFTDKNIEANTILQAKANNISWSMDSNQLIYFTDFELWIYNFKTKEKQLLNRYGHAIVQAVWYPNNKYVIYRTNETIRVIKTFAGEVKNDITLTTTNSINSLTLDRDGHNIYFNGEIGAKSGIYQLTIQ